MDAWVAERLAQHRAANTSFEQKLPNGRGLKIAEAESRVHTMALVHEVLYRSDNLSEIDLQLYLENLSEHLLSVFKSQEAGTDIVIDAGGVTFGIEQAVPCGLIATELLTNALVYAYPQDEGGGSWKMKWW